MMLSSFALFPGLCAKMSKTSTCLECHRNRAEVIA